MPLSDQSFGNNGGVQVTARIDYAVRALLELAAADGGRLTCDELAGAQEIAPRYLEAIMGQLRQAGLVRSQRGIGGGFVLNRPPAEITVAEISRAVDGPLAVVQGMRPEHIEYAGTSQHLGDLWIGLRAAIRNVMERVTIADLLTGDLPASVQELVDNPDAWAPR